MEIVSEYEHIRLLTDQEMETIEAGALIPWGSIVVGLAVGLVTNLPEAWHGAVDGWNAYHH